MYVSLLPRCWSVAALCLIILNPLTAQAPSVLEQRIRRIEGGIIQSPILVKDEPASTVTLADRMAALHVPGVSIAVIQRRQDRMGARLRRRQDRWAPRNARHPLSSGIN